MWVNRLVFTSIDGHQEPFQLAFRSVHIYAPEYMLPNPIILFGNWNYQKTYKMPVYCKIQCN